MKYEKLFFKSCTVFKNRKSESLNNDGKWIVHYMYHCGKTMIENVPLLYL